MVHLVPCSSDTEVQANRRVGSAETDILNYLPKNGDRGGSFHRILEWNVERKNLYIRKTCFIEAER